MVRTVRLSGAASCHTAACGTSVAANAWQAPTASASTSPQGSGAGIADPPAAGRWQDASRDRRLEHFVLGTCHFGRARACARGQPRSTQTEQPFLRTARDSRASETRQEPGTEAQPQTQMPRRDDEKGQTRTKRKVHPGLIEADNEEVAIVVHFETSNLLKLRTPHVTASETEDAR